MENKSDLRYVSQEALAQEQSDFLSKVYAWMLGGLVITALTAFYAPQFPFVQQIITSPWIWAIIVAEFVLVIAISGFIHKMTAPVAGLLFAFYSFLNGLVFSVIFLAYASTTIYTTFFVTAGMFGAMSAVGYFTKKDLSGMGRFMMMGLIGIIIALVVNIFIQSSALHFVISVIGVLVFAGLTAYDTQKLKEMYVEMRGNNELAAKGAITGALRLYLDFVNLFLFLLRLLGGRD